MYSPERIQQIVDTVKIHGEAKTAEIYNVNIETIYRVGRIAKFKKENKRAPKILVVDIETLPMQVRVWGLYKQRIPTDNIVRDWLMLCWSAKWLFAPDVINDCLTPADCKNWTDKRITKSIHKLINEADIVIAHNLKRFDMRRLRSRFIMNGLPPYSPIQMIDTLVHSRTNFAHSSHKLDHLGKLMRGKGKISTGYSLWLRCEAGEQKALDEMQAYCDEDVFLDEEYYLHIRPWISGHPNIALYQDCDGIACRNCGGKVKDIGKYKYTNVNRYTSFQCQEPDCGAYSRSRYTDVSKPERRTILS